MTIPFRVRSLTLAAAAALTALGCGKDNGPGDDPGDDPDLLRLFVMAQPDADFATSGGVVFDLIPTNQAGDNFLNDDWTVAVTATSPTGLSATFVPPLQRPMPDPTPVASALLIDDSNSMMDNDPDRQRAAGAQLFWQTLLDNQPGSLVAFAAFGIPTAQVSPGFQRTRLFQDLTSDQAALASHLDELVAASSPGTPLFRSGAELIPYITTTMPSGTFSRVLTVLTDGLDTEPEFMDDLVAAANASSTRIFAIGIGPASDVDPAADPTAVQNLRTIASQTNGIYAGASSANTLRAVFQSLATSQVQAKLLSRFTFNPVPAPGTVVTGTITLTGTRGTVSTSYTFTAS